MKVSRVVLVLALVVVVLSLSVFVSPSAHAATAHTAYSCPGISYSPGKVWHPGNGDTVNACSSRKLHLVYQTDGNFVLYCDSTPLWATGTDGPASSAGYASFQKDGNFVVYGYNRLGWLLASWASNTNNEGATQLALQGDGNLVIYNSSHTALWATDTSGQCSFNL